MAPFKQKFWLKWATSNFRDLNQSNLIYALLLRIQLCRDYALFEGHFGQNLLSGVTKTF